MANIKSAIKRIQVAERNRLRNKSEKSAVRTVIKKYFTAVDNYAANRTEELQQEVNQLMSKAYSKIDKAVKHGVLHKNNGARKKSRLARYYKRHLLVTGSEPESMANEGSQAS
ncbi:MAG: 30S ribosomal protein S20 [Microcoleaceae cyanobacterium MO_207.B10]|nr:30S ribosomal protein S20 [Microcoleaceae cyanobacterium MO_207.B10]